MAINNVELLRQSIHSLVIGLRDDDIIKNVFDFCGPLNEHDTNAIDTVKDKIKRMIHKLSKKMNPEMQRLLTEGAKHLNTDPNSMDQLIIYIKDSLETFQKEVNDDNFHRVLDAIWEEITILLYDLVQRSQKKRRPQSFYLNLHGSLKIMVEDFKYQSNEICSSDKEEKIDKILGLYSTETADLILNYYKERYSMQQNIVYLEQNRELSTRQKEIEDAPFGFLTVRCFFDENTLKIEILNAKQLPPMDRNGQRKFCDPFVKIHLYPEEKFLKTSRPKTKVHQDMLCPLFEEELSM